MSSFYAYQKPGDPQVYVTDPAGTIEMGDLVKWNTGTSMVDRLGAAADAAAFLGVAEGQIPVASNIDNATGLENKIRVRQSGIFLFKTTAAESYVHGDAVTIGADNQTILKTATPAEVIGYINLPDGNTVVGAAGLRIEVQIKRNFPTASFI
jgi:hypothetical protein